MTMSFSQLFVCLYFVWILYYFCWLCFVCQRRQILASDGSQAHSFQTNLPIIVYILNRKSTWRIMKTNVKFPFPSAFFMHEHFLFCMPFSLHLTFKCPLCWIQWIPYSSVNHWIFALRTYIYISNVVSRFFFFFCFLLCFLTMILAMFCFLYSAQCPSNVIFYLFYIFRRNASGINYLFIHFITIMWVA